jgi:hypothetical protein
MSNLVWLTVAAMVAFLLLLLPANYLMSFLLTRDPSDFFRKIVGTRTTIGTRGAIEGSDRAAFAELLRGTSTTASSSASDVTMRFPPGQSTILLKPFYPVGANAAVTVERRLHG